MKLIIDIPKELAEKGHWYTDEEMWTVIKAAQNGIPCDIEQISSARYNNGFYDGKKAMEEKLEQIRAEIDGIEIDGQIDIHTMFTRTGEQVKKMALDIIDRYVKGGE